jgi:Nif-specific regulatory protein
MFCDKYKRACYADSDLSFLLNISVVIAHSSDIHKDLELILEEVCKYLDARYSFITIVDRDDDVIMIGSAYGLTEAERKKGIYKTGEGIIGEVVSSGEPVVIPDISKSDKFLNKIGLAMKGKRPMAFLCVPIINNNVVIGTLSIHKLHPDLTDFSADEKFLSIIGMLIGKNITIRRKHIAELDELRKENLRLKGDRSFKPDNIIGNSALMHDLYSMIEKVSPTNSTVMIRGESGVGKELIAEAIHNASPRCGKPFVKVNCSALSETLIESELFGHEKGSFTGADHTRAGRFEVANGGTLFLDEIGDIPLSVQVKLLRVIQQRQIERVGGNKSIDIDVRLITATNKNLEEMLKNNTFREDFYWRINVFPIFVPALRERKADLPLLIDHFISKINKRNGMNIKRITGGALDLLMVYNWPGNIRELENVIERSMILSTDGVVHSYNLPPTLQTAFSSNTAKKGTLNNVLEKVEKQLIKDTLVITQGNVSKAAQQLGITDRILGLRINKYELDIKDFRNLSNEVN